jgi:hypothetical protein
MTVVVMKIKWLPSTVLKTCLCLRVHKCQGIFPEIVKTCLIFTPFVLLWM